jgi:pimeloyl-ACP methyl ester carboxylesterase
MRNNLFILEPVQRSSQPVRFDEPNPTITIWIHGTRFFYHNLYHGMPYRNNLLHAQHTPLPLTLKRIGETLHKTDPDRFNPAHFYIFSWSGKLCFLERESAAQALHQELTNLISAYQQAHNCIPRIRIIAHSHGGNVALNLALRQQQSLNIDELILLACPVQEKTKYLVQHPMFKKIYALYSALDIVQIIDPQGMYKHRGKSDHLFSKRNFPHREGLAQMKIKVDRRALTHFEFTQSFFLALLPKILRGIDLWDKKICYLEDPNKINKILCVYTKKTNLKTPAIYL